MCRVTKLHHLNHSGLSILIPIGVLDALGSIPNCGPAHAGTMGYHLGDLDAVVRGVGGLVDRGQEHTQEEEVLVTVMVLSWRGRC